MGSPCEGQAPQTSTFVESCGPSHASGVPLSASSRMLPAIFTIELPVEMPRASFPPVHGGGGGVTQTRMSRSRNTLAPLGMILQWLVQEPRGFVGFV
jgi:hypothetical protein